MYWVMNKVYNYYVEAKNIKKAKEVARKMAKEMKEIFPILNKEWILKSIKVYKITEIKEADDVHKIVGK